MEIKAFKGYRYDCDKVGEVGKCISPPYDVIDDDKQQELYDLSPYNIVRVIKNKELPGGDKYAQAGDFFDELVENGILKADDNDSIYGYVQDFTLNSKFYQRSGFVALGKLVEFGRGVQAHENTLDGPKADRLNLMRATGAQFGQVFMIYDDPGNIADKLIAKAAARPALIDFTDDQNVRHRLFAIDNPADISAVVEMMKSKTPVIADGHHRYETALNFYNETQNPDALYRMMTFVNMRNEGMIVLATHRLVKNLSSFSLPILLEELKDNFVITELGYSSVDEKISARERMFAIMREQFEMGNNCFGIYANTEAFYTAALKDTGAMEVYADQMSPASRRLDAAVLHKLILEEKLGIDAKKLAEQSNIEYIKDIGNAVEASMSEVDLGHGQAVFFMNPTKMEQIKAVAAAGERMPQKSTFFHPKVFTGLVINKLNAERVVKK